MHSKLGRKILIFTLLITLSMCVALFCVAYIDMNSIKDAAFSTNEELGAKSSEIVSNGITKEMNSAIMQVTTEKAENHNNEFSTIQQQIGLMCGVLRHEYMYSDKAEGYVPLEPNKTEDGVLMSRCAVAKRFENNDEVKEEIKTITQMEPLVKAVYSSSEFTRNVMVGTKTGIFYRYSDYNTFDEDYDVTVRPWFLAAMEEPGKVIWSDAYTDALGKYVITVSCAYMNEKGEYEGVVASDITIQTLIDSVLVRDKIGNGYAFLLDENGKYLAHPSIKSEGFNNDPVADGDSVKKQIVKQMVSGGTGKASFEKDGEKMYVFFAPIKATKWTFAMVVPESSMTKPIAEATTIIDEGMVNAKDDMDEIIRSLLAAFIMIFIVIILILIVASLQMTNLIAKPVEKMVEGTTEIGKGNFEYRIEVNGKDELATLGSSINKMAGDLDKYITELTEVTAERQKIGAELNVAKSIQENMLPKIFPKFSSHEYYALSASMHPAKEVGGDFYDFFMIDDDHFAMVIADVSGKGVPAALFMVISKTLIKSRAMMGGSVSEILASVNDQLCEANGADMFVTVLLGIINIKTGHMEYANAGHENPIIRRKDGDFYANTVKHSFVIGGMDGMVYKEFTVDLDEGDMIFTYTDGVPEANNSQGEMYGMDRTLCVLNENKNADPDELINIVYEDVMKFTGNAAQFDDITMLCYEQLKVEKE